MGKMLRNACLFISMLLAFAACSNSSGSGADNPPPDGKLGLDLYALLEASMPSEEEVLAAIIASPDGIAKLSALQESTPQDHNHFGLTYLSMEVYVNGTLVGDELVPPLNVADAITGFITYSYTYYEDPWTDTFVDPPVDYPGTDLIAGEITFNYVFDFTLGEFIADDPSYTISPTDADGFGIIGGDVVNAILDAHTPGVARDGRVPYATIYAENETSGAIFSARADVNGDFEMIATVGTYKVSAFAPGFLETVEDGVIVAGLLTTSVALDLLPEPDGLTETCDLQGVVNSLDPAVIADAFVSLYNPTNGMAIDGLNASLTNAVGEYSILNVPEGSYIIMASIGSKSGEVELTVVSNGSSCEIDTEIIIADRYPVCGDITSTNGVDLSSPVEPGTVIEFVIDSSDPDPEPDADVLYHDFHAFQYDASITNDPATPEDERRLSQGCGIFLVPGEFTFAETTWQAPEATDHGACLITTEVCDGGLCCESEIVINVTTVGDDLDCDGYTSDVDCNDNDARINPGAVTDICGDLIDQDCNGVDPTCGDEGWELGDLGRIMFPDNYVDLGVSDQFVEEIWTAELFNIPGDPAFLVKQMQLVDDDLYITRSGNRIVRFNSLSPTDYDAFSFELPNGVYLAHGIYINLGELPTDPDIWYIGWVRNGNDAIASYSDPVTTGTNAIVSSIDVGTTNVNALTMIPWGTAGGARIVGTRTYYGGTSWSKGLTLCSLDLGSCEQRTYMGGSGTFDVTIDAGLNIWTTAFDEGTINMSERLVNGTNVNSRNIMDDNIKKPAGLNFDLQQNLYVFTGDSHASSDFPYESQVLKYESPDYASESILATGFQRLTLIGGSHSNDLVITDDGVIYAGSFGSIYKLSGSHPRNMCQ
jgi:Putative metal-binding motif